MQLSVNGREKELSDGTSLVQLIELMQLDRRFLVVEHNGQALRREQFDGIVLADGDRLELVRPVAGG